MDTPPPSNASEKANKLIIRSEVLSIIRHLASLVEPSKQERLKQVNRLHEINEPEHVQDILVKELQRCDSPEMLQVIIEFLMEVGEIDYIREKLWGVIRDVKTRDEIKDAANLILRYLGDVTDPDLYLNYLEDPQGLIGRETVRMLEVSAENPEALIDFIDFILSLREEDQMKLLHSLQSDYPSEYLVNIYVPLLESDPPVELWKLLIANLGESRSSKAATVLNRLSRWPEDRLPVPKKLVEKALKQLQIAGAYHPGNNAKQADEEALHPLIIGTTVFECFTTISDGIGNQGIIFSRQRANGDISMLCVALNDTHGIIDCFGFFQLSMADFRKIVDKFHEGSTKIKVEPEYCAYKLSAAEGLNVENTLRIPYEYRCWAPLFSDILAERPADMDEFRQWVREDWFLETNNLYEHPDFSSWFLEQGDEPSVTRHLQKVILHTEDYLMNPSKPLDDYITTLESIADSLALELIATDWRHHLKQRLIEAAYLFHCQKTHTFRTLAATEAYKLETLKDPSQLLPGFLQAYGRRCIEEELLRLKMGSASYEQIAPLVNAVLERWSSTQTFS